jgi:light-regulated signal transduction histidine kinase (bacteriophytochrome)
MVSTRDRAGKAYTEDDQVFFQDLVDRVAIAITNSRLYADLQLELEGRRRVEEQLRANATILERNNRELQDFAYVASHDLQEPLRKIRAFGDRLVAKTDGMDEQGKDYVSRMQVAAGRMQTLIEDLLTYSRVTTKAQPFRQANLEQVANDVVNDLEIRIEQNNARVELGALPTIEADPVQMRQVFQNLIGNAIKFHKPDEQPVVKVWSDTQNGDCLVYVADNGIGFDEKYLDRIFVPFQRLHGRNEYEGTGIGLAVVRKIAERHRGSVTAISKPNEGSTFVVTLPIHQTDQEKEVKGP